MAKWIASILAIIVVAGAAYYFWHIRPQQAAYRAERAEAAHRDLELALLIPRFHALESVREELDRTIAQLCDELAATHCNARAAS